MPIERAPRGRWGCGEGHCKGWRVSDSRGWGAGREGNVSPVRVRHGGCCDLMPEKRKEMELKLIGREELRMWI